MDYMYIFKMVAQGYEAEDKNIHCKIEKYHGSIPALVVKKDKKLAVFEVVNEKPLFMLLILDGHRFIPLMGEDGWEKAGKIIAEYLY